MDAQMLVIDNEVKQGDDKHHPRRLCYALLRFAFFEGA